jgi:hypothetical protein
MSEANSDPIDAQPQVDHPEGTSIGMYVSDADVQKYLLEEVTRLTLENAQLRATCMKLLRERNE